jgi:hypothetical protein
MKVWVLAGLFTVAMAPAAFAVEDPAECLLDETRRAMEPRAEAPAAPQANVARPTVAQRNDAAEPEATPRPAPVERRRSVKRIPDAQLIGPRGAL